MTGWDKKCRLVSISLHFYVILIMYLSILSFGNGFLLSCNDPFMNEMNGFVSCLRK